jgi:hypothetical protein
MTTADLDRATLAEMNAITQLVIDGKLRGPEATERLRELTQQVHAERARIQAKAAQAAEEEA